MALAPEVVNGTLGRRVRRTLADSPIWLNLDRELLLLWFFQQDDAEFKVRTEYPCTNIALPVSSQLAVLWNRLKGFGDDALVLLP